MPKVLVFAWEMGGATALTPLLPVLAAKGFEVHVLAVKPALKWFQDEVSKVAVVEEFQSGAADYLDYQVCLAGFGHPRQAFGLRAWMEVSANKKSLVVLDAWKGLDRFFHPKGEPRVEALPTRIAVMDSVTAGVLKDMGLPPEIMIVTGHPLLHVCSADKYFQKNVGPDYIKGKLGIEPGRSVCLLGSEIVHSHGFYQACTPACRSLFQLESGGRELWQAVVDEANNQLDNPIFIMRPHPNERFEHDHLLTVNWSKASNRDLLAISDRVYGLSSMLIMQAAALGKQTVCLDKAVAGWIPRNSFLLPETWSYLKKTSQLGDRAGGRPACADHGSAIQRVVLEVEKLVNEAKGF